MLNNGLTAVRADTQKDLNFASVTTNRPLKDNEIFEVVVEEMEDRWNGEPNFKNGGGGGGNASKTSWQRKKTTMHIAVIRRHLLLFQVPSRSESQALLRSSSPGQVAEKDTLDETRICYPGVP